MVQSTPKTLAGALALVAVAGLSSCGGGGGGNSSTPTLQTVTVTAAGPGSAAPHTQEAAFLVGSLLSGTTTYSPYLVNVDNPSLGLNGVPLPVIPLAAPFSWGTAQFQVAAPVMANPPAGSQSFIELQFGSPVKASSVRSTQAGVTDGITLFYVGGTGSPATQNGLVQFRLDAAGAIDASNVVTNDAAPSTLRLYYDSDNAFGTPDAFPAGQYLLRINSTLRLLPNAGDTVGVPFSNQLTSSGLASGSAVPVYPSWGFSIGADTVTLDTTGPAEGIQVGGVSANGSSGVALNSEIILNFNDAVDFPTLVGAGNLTSRDPFITVPFGVAQIGADGLPGTADDGGPFTIGNLTLNYGLPVNPLTNLPSQVPVDLSNVIPGLPINCSQNLGVVVYMPDPKKNPTQVRVRFINTNGLVGAEVAATAQYQNYASNPDLLPIRSNNPALINPATNLAPLLTLPAAVPVPGSIAAVPTTALATFTVTILGGATDRSANAATSRTATFTWAIGGLPATNPMSIDLLLIGMQTGSGVNAVPGIAAGNSATLTIGNGPGGLLTGNLTVRPQPLQNSALLGVPLDFEIDLPCNPFWAQVGWDVPRGTITPGIPDSPTQTITTVLYTVPPPTVPPAHGNPIYVVDGTSSSLKIFNAFDWSLVSTIQGVGSPGGLGMSPNFSELFVSNTDQGTIQRIDLNPASANFQQVTTTINVGNGPRAISVTPSNEDIFVCNYADNSVSVIKKTSLTERIKLSVGQGPSDVYITARMLGMGLTNNYQAFILNEFSNTIDVYESAGGSELSNEPNGRILATGTGFLRPKRGSWNYQTYLGGPPVEPGIVVANVAGTLVNEFTMFFFQLGPPPGFPGTPARRDMHVLRSFNASSVAPNASPSDATPDAMTAMPIAGANRALTDPAANQGAGPRALLVSYPSAGRIVVFDYANGTSVIGSVSVPGCDFLHNMLSQ
jgi:YVTN family beta-propeller protein